MIMDHYWDKWKPYIPVPQYPNVVPITPTVPMVPLVPYTPPVPFTIKPDVPIPQISPAEIEEFRKLLERAREYDKKHNEPDCEIEEKKQKLRELAEQLGVKIEFP